MVFLLRGLCICREEIWGDAACKDQLSRPVRSCAANMVGSWGSASFLGLWSKTRGFSQKKKPFFLLKQRLSRVTPWSGTLWFPGLEPAAPHRVWVWVRRAFAEVVPGKKNQPQTTQSHIIFLICFVKQPFGFQAPLSPRGQRTCCSLSLCLPHRPDKIALDW